jgi:hypothetical protein
VANLTFLFSQYCHFLKNIRQGKIRPPKKKTLEESTLLSQEVKQTDKELPLTRPCWMDRSEV